MSKHTPGPWTIKKRADKTFDSYEGRLTVMDGRQFYIASVHADADEKEAVGTAEQISNAHLIASAPTMREVLEHVLEEFEDRYDGAPDARMQWMGELMHEIKGVLAEGGTR